MDEYKDDQPCMRSWTERIWDVISTSIILFCDIFRNGDKDNLADDLLLAKI